MFNKNAVFIVLLCLGLSVVEGRAETLRDAVAASLAQHPSVKAAQLSHSASLDALKAARAHYLPTLDVQLDAGREQAETGTTRALGDDDGVTTTRRSVQVRVGQRLFDGLETPRRVEAAKALAEAADFGRIETLEEQALAAVQAYLNVLRGRRQLEVARSSLEVHKKLVENIELRQNLGGGGQGEVNQARSRLSLVLSRLAELEGALKNAEADYVESVGAQPADLQTAEPLAVPSTPEAAVAEAASANPTLRSRRSVADSRQAEVGVAKASFWPRFDLELSENREWDAAGVDGRTTDRRAMVVMRYSVFAGGRDVARKQEAKDRAREAEQQVARAQLLVERQVRAEYNAYDSAVRQAQYLADRVEAQDATVAVYRDQFIAGRKSLLDVLDAEYERLQAGLEHINVEYRKIALSYQIWASVGKLVESMGLSTP